MTPSILPRWEWRTFGESFGAAESALTEWEPTGTSESDERYLVTAAAENVKIRDDLLDIKVLREVDAHGLERWEPTLKAPFPLDAATLATVFAALRTPEPPLTRSSYDEAEFFSALIDTNPAIRVARVHKRRLRYERGACMGELTDFEVDGFRTRTLALESTDPDAVIEQIATLGLAHQPNTSVPAALRSF